MEIFRLRAFALLPAILLLFGAACGGSGGAAAVSPSQQQSGNSILLYVMAGSATPAPGTLGTQSVNYSFTAPNQSVQILVNQVNYTSAFTITSACQTPTQSQGASGVATASFAAPASNGPQAVMTVTSGANGGNCIFDVKGGAGKTATVFVGNTVTTGNISSKGTSR